MGSEKQKQKVKGVGGQGSGARVQAASSSPPPAPPAPGPWPLAPALVLIVIVLAAYANHFHNGFYFDDSHSIIDNPAIRTLRNIPRFFTDASLFSSIKGLQVYRPVLSVSLAIDYWLARGYHPFFFHLSTFFWYSVQLVLMFLLFRRMMDWATAQQTTQNDGLFHSYNTWTALFAAACYGLHPANAETVNYIIQRGDLYNTVAVVGSLYWFAADPKRRKQCWYLIPAIAGCLAKAPALIFPFILLAYAFLIEEDRNWLRAFRATWPAFLAGAAAAVLTMEMTPSTYGSGAGSPARYVATQPWVMLHYFKVFFLPTDLNVDAAWNYVSPLGVKAIAGYLFVIAMIAAAVWTSRQRRTRIISFGIVWFFLALLPTSLTPLTDVTNDHRMFFPFVGLALAVVWSLRLVSVSSTDHRFLWSVKPVVKLWPVLLALPLIAEAAGTHVRNSVWSTEESLWRDSTAKNPNNGRAWMGVGYSVFQRRDFENSVTYFERALSLSPYDPNIEIALGRAYGQIGRSSDAEHHFQRAIALAPSSWRTYSYFGAWLKDAGRLAEAQTQLEASVRLDADAVPSRELLMEVYTRQLNFSALQPLARETLTLDPTNQAAMRYMAMAGQMPVATAAPAPVPTPANIAPAADADKALDQSTEYCKKGMYPECLAAATQALQMRPGWEKAYNNMAAAFYYLGRWDEGIRASQQALSIKPDYEAAKKNLMFGMQRKAQNEAKR